MTKDILEHFPRLPSIETRGDFSPADRERWESADLEPFAFGSVRLEGGFRAAVLQGCREFGDIEPDFAGDFRLYRFPMDRSSVETPSLAQGPQVPPALAGSLEGRRLGGNARWPRRVEIIDLIDHPIGVHRHPVLARDGLEERTDRFRPSAPGHAGPLFAERGEVLE